MTKPENRCTINEEFLQTNIQDTIMIQFNDLTSKSLLQDLSGKEAIGILGGTYGPIVEELKLAMSNLGAVASAQINSSGSIGLQTASRQIAKQFSDGLWQTAR
jgi:hypothetical protein